MTSTAATATGAFPPDEPEPPDRLRSGVSRLFRATESVLLPPQSPSPTLIDPVTEILSSACFVHNNVSVQLSVLASAPCLHPAVWESDSLVNVCQLALVVNSLGWLGLVQPFGSTSDSFVAFPRASPAICSLWSVLLKIIARTRPHIFSFFKWQPRISLSPFSLSMTSEGMFFVTLLLVMQWSRNCLLLVPNYLSMRFRQVRLPHYEVVSSIKFDQSFTWSSIRSPFGGSFDRLSLNAFVLCFGMDLNGSAHLPERLDGDSDFPCIEEFFSLVLTVVAAKGLVPSISLGVFCVVDRLCDGLCFTKPDIYVKLSLLVFLPSPKIEAYRIYMASFFPASRMAKRIGCFLGWFIKDPLKATIQQELFSRPFVSSTLVVEALALKSAIGVALASGVSRLACYSDCKEVILLLNVDGQANEVDGVFADIKLQGTKFPTFSFLLVLPTSVDSCNISSFNGV